MNISEKKQKLIDEFLKTPIKVGEMIYVRQSLLGYYVTDKTNERNILVIVTKINEDGSLIVKEELISRAQEYTIFPEEVLDRYQVNDVGANPFNKRGSDIRPIAYSLDSIIFNFELDKRESKTKTPYYFDGVLCQELNWNPFVYDKNGQKLYYQRDFCWTLEEKQALIEYVKSLLTKV